MISCMHSRAVHNACIVRPIYVRKSVNVREGVLTYEHFFLSYFVKRLFLCLMLSLTNCITISFQKILKTILCYVMLC